MKTYINGTVMVNPSQTNELTSSIGDQIRKLTGFGEQTEPRPGCSLSPTSYFSAYRSQHSRAQKDNPTDYGRAMQLVDTIRTLLNSIATAVRASFTERAYLSALVDVLNLKPLNIVKERYYVRFTAKDAKDYLGLSASSCTTIRQSLQEKGLITIEGDFIDLSPLLWALSNTSSHSGEKPASDSLADISRADQNFRDALPKSGTINSNVNLNKKTITVNHQAKVSQDLFSRHAIFEALSLSPRISSAITEHFGRSYKDVHIEDIITAMPNLAHSLLCDGSTFCYRTAWKIIYRKHKLMAFGLLICAVEGQTQHPGKWFFTMGKRENIDLRANIQSISNARGSEELEEKKKIHVALEKRKREQSQSLQQILSAKALDVLKEIKASGSYVADSFFWSMVGSRIQVKGDGETGLLAIRRFNNIPSNVDERDNILLTLVERLGRCLFNDRYKVVNGTIPGLQPIASGAI